MNPSPAFARSMPAQNKTTPHIKLAAAAIAAACLFAGLAPGRAAASTRRSASVPLTLGADNVITAARSAYTTVTIPNDVKYLAKTGENPYFRFSGRGRFVGVFLVAAGVGLDEHGASLFAGRYTFCGKAACEATDTTQFLIARGTLGAGELPAGEYRLYLITDGAPATARIRFDGVSGKTKVRPQTPVDTEVMEPETSLSAPRNVAYSYGRSYDFEGVKGLTFSVLSIEGDAWAAGRYGTCIYRGNPPLPPPIAYGAPECPGGLSLAQVDANVRPSRFRIDTYAQTIYDPGRWTVGAFYQAAGLIDGARALDVVVDLPTH